MPKVIIKSRGPITLSDSKDFKAQGGEANIFVQGNTVFKIWHDPKQLPSLAKMVELKTLSSAANFIIPEDVILDPKTNNPIGITMRFVDKAYVLCQLFPKAFRDRMKLTPQTVLSLVRNIQDGMNFAHSKDILIVDLNEMNFLVPENFKEVLFIDTTTYQTPHFPATALMESVRDRHTIGFSKGTDYFAFAVVSFNLFIGIHPYRGKFPAIDSAVAKDHRMEARMQKNVSVLHKGVSLPGACLPFDVIPPVYRDWYTAVFENGKREAPPKDLQAVVQLAPQVTHVSGSQHFDINLYFEYDDEVSAYYKDVVLTRKSVYVNNRRVGAVPASAHIGITPKMTHPIVAHLEKDRVQLYDTESGQILPAIQLSASGLMSYEGRLYLHAGEKLFEIDYLERANMILPGIRAVANVMARSTQLFEGVAIQYMLKSYYAIMAPEPGTTFQVRLKEFENYKIIEAKFSHGVLMIVAVKNGKYDKLIYRFSETFDDYNLTHVQDINYTGLNFTVRDDGIVLHMNHEDDIEVFKAKMGTLVTTITDSGIQSDAKLLHMGIQSMFARGSRLYRFNAKK